MMGEHIHRGMEGRVLSPPALPVLVDPRTVLGAELTPAHDLGANVVAPGAGEDAVDAVCAAAVVIHRTEHSGREEPFVELRPGVPERRLQTLTFAGAIAVERDCEVVDADTRHADLLADRRVVGNSYGNLPTGDRKLG